MREGWEYKKIGEICDVYNGSTPLRRNNEFWNNGDINWFTVDDIRDQGRVINSTVQKITELGFKSSSLKLLPPKSILICCTASVGEYAITNIELTTNQQFNGMVIKDFELVLPEYLFHFSSTLKNQLLEVSGKTTIDFVSMTKLRNVDIPIPPLTEQKQIVAILDRAFAAIDQAKANIEKNIENAKELFQSKLNEIFSHPSTGSGQEGDGWEEKKLGEMSKIMYGYTSKVVEVGNIQYVRITDIQNGSIDWNSVPFVNISDEDKTKYELGKGDIVFARTGATTGKSYLMEEPPNSVFASYLIRVQCDTDILEPSFLYLFFQSGLYWKIVESGISGSAQGGFNASKLGEMIIHFPKDKDQQHEYVDLISSIKTPIQEMEDHYQNKLSNLEELKKSILQKAFAGELTVSNHDLKDLQITRL